MSPWRFAPLVDVGLVLLAGGYLLGVWRIHQRHRARPWPAHRAAAFLLALGVIAVATQSSIDVYDDVLFSMHMIQHVLLIMVAPPLLVFGRPVTLLLHAVRNPLHTWAKRAVRSPVAAALTWPPGTAVLYAVVVAGTHTPPFMDLVVENGTAHNAEHVLYLITGYLLFLLIIGSEPIRRRVALPGRFLLLLAAMQVDTVVGVVLMLAPGGTFAAYARAGRTWGPSVVTDLHHGGMIMFIGSDIVMTIPALAICAMFVNGSRHAGNIGSWVESLRRSSLLRKITEAGIATPQTPAAGHTIDDDAHLAAYNACLTTVSTRRARPYHDQRSQSRPNHLPERTSAK
ncbi:MAG: cytochrome c oxidase assembly protein [Micromonosporaceae bacterium]